MSVETVRDALLWCAVINYGMLLWWFVFFRFGHAGMLRLHGRWFSVSADRFDAIHYALMGMYKVGILLFNLVPYIALRIVG